MRIGIDRDIRKIDTERLAVGILLGFYRHSELFKQLFRLVITAFGFVLGTFAHALGKSRRRVKADGIDAVCLLLYFVAKLVQLLEQCVSLLEIRGVYLGVLGVFFGQERVEPHTKG